MLYFGDGLDNLMNLDNIFRFWIVCTMVLWQRAGVVVYRQGVSGFIVFGPSGVWLCTLTRYAVDAGVWCIFTYF